MNMDTLDLGLGLLSWSCESAASEAAMNVLLFLLSGLENLRDHQSVLLAGFSGIRYIERTWKEQSKLSSTLIIAPALSNSPQ